jgi:hypothetical protein
VNVARGTRSVALDVNATRPPPAEIASPTFNPSSCAPADDTLILVVIGTAPAAPTPDAVTTAQPAATAATAARHNPRLIRMVPIRA